MKNQSTLFAFVLLLFPSLIFTQQRPKNIILLIGDGMGISQITAGMYSKGRPLNLERFKYIGLIKTHSSDNLITDSAAGATAFASGVKTYNGAIGVDTSGTAVPTILEIASGYQLSTGVIATSTIQHATPAAFYAHQPSRTLYEEITTDFLNGKVNIAIGGGRRLFEKRKDERNIAVELQHMGYQFYEKLKDAQKEPVQNMMVITEKGHLSSVNRGRNHFLREATELAISQLDKNPNGFFLMIEGSQIDWGGHSNNGDYIISEMIDFDNTIGEVLDFAEKDQETLVIVTADHETGGFSVNNKNDRNGKLETAFTTDKHTADLIPVFAFGPSAESFTGIYDNTEIYYKMMEAYEFEGYRTYRSADK